MAGLTNLHDILGALRPRVRAGSFVYVTLPEPPETPEAPDASLGDLAHARIVEDEGVTLVLDQAVADERGLPYDEVFGWITLQAHTSLSAVGVTAAVATALARIGLSCNVLAGWYHDHLLVPRDDVDEAVAALGGLE